MKKALLVTALLATVGYGGWRLVRHGDSPVTTDDTKLALDRIWVDHMPRTERDTIQVFAGITDEQFGLFQATSSWKGNFELFVFKINGDKIRITYPQDGTKEDVRLKARPCKEGDMDYCMEVEGSSRGVKKYYSRKGWEIDAAAHSAADVERRAHEIESELESGLPAE